MADIIRVAVLGACGRMGREVVRAVASAADMQVVGACDVVLVGSTLADIAGVRELDIPIERDFDQMCEKSKPDVVVDFAKPFVMENTRAAMKRGIVPIIGTTGQTVEELNEIAQLAETTGTAAMVIPNFAIGAVLMMKFAAEAARYMPDVEIIELHHSGKVDAPSGTAIKTAEMIDSARKAANAEVSPAAGPANSPSRGERRNGIQVHSVRLPGLVAHQEVIFGGQGQILTIRHDSIDRTSFMPGVLLAVRQASCVRGFVYGLDKLI